MRPPALPPNEAERLAELYGYDILDTPGDRVFDAIAELAATIAGTRSAGITLVDRERQWFKAAHGLACEQSTREESVCGHAILGHDFFEVPDLRSDERFAGNAFLEQSDPPIRFYGGSQLVSPNGHPLGMLCVLDAEPRQLDERQRQALRTLSQLAMGLMEDHRHRRQQEWFARIIDSVADEVFVADAQTHGYVHANRTALDNLGYTLEQLRGLTPVDISPSLTRDEFGGHVRRLLDGVPEVNYEGERERSNGERYPVEIRWQLLQDRKRPLIVALVHDISERKAVEKMKDEFVSVVNHELRTPLTSVHGAIKLLATGAAGALPPQAQYLVQLAASNTDRLAAIINDILDLEKIASGRMELALATLDAAQQLQEVAQAHEGSAQAAGVAITNRAAPGLQLRGDPLRLHQVLGNLVSNALKYAPRGSAVELDALDEGAQVRLTVTDHGSGVPEDFRDRIFQRFAQADMQTTREKGGSGLGLSIVKRMTEQMGGSVGYDSRPGHTVFHACLPKAAT